MATGCVTDPDAAAALRLSMIGVVVVDVLDAVPPSSRWSMKCACRNGSLPGSSRAYGVGIASVQMTATSSSGVVVWNVNWSPAPLHRSFR